MKKRKLAGLFLCFALALGVALPLTMAIPTYADGSSEEKDEMVVIATGSVPSESEDRGDTEAGSENSGNAETVEVATAPDATKPTSGGGCTHIDTCLEGCTGEDCACPCHNTLFVRLMAAETLEELYAIIDETAEEDLLALTDVEISQIEAKMAELEPEPLPEIVINGSSDEPVISEIIYPTINFDNVAPFGDPVIG